MKKIAMIAMIALSAMTSNVAFAAEVVETTILYVFTDGVGNSTQVLLAHDWSDGTTTYELADVERH